MKYVIGDIHGQYHELLDLIKLTIPNATEYVFLGDYIDRGKYSKEVVDYLIDLSKIIKCTFLMGNHEHMWGGYIKKEFYDKLVYYHKIGNAYICVHAGINPEYKDIDISLHDKEDLVWIRWDFIKSKFFYQGRRIIFGHTSFGEPYIDKYKIGINTGMKTLTAFCVEGKYFVNNRGEEK